jgi:hypothetical protein
MAVHGAGGRGTRVRLWRWRRNPLLRRSDRVERWAIVAVGLLLAVGAPAVGTMTGIGFEAAALRQSQEWRRVPAVLIQDAPPSTGVYVGSADDRVRATVRWTAPDGAARTGKALVEPGSRAGTGTTVWLALDGTLKQPPASPSEARAQGVVLGALAATGTGVLALGGLWTIRFELDARRDRDWEREWGEIDPRWGSRRS